MMKKTYDKPELIDLKNLSNLVTIGFCVETAA